MNKNYMETAGSSVPYGSAANMNVTNKNTTISGLNNNSKKACSLTGLVYKDILSNDPILTGKCGYLGKSKCPPPIKATYPGIGSRGIPIAGSYNRPGFMLTRPSRTTHAVNYNKASFRFYEQNVNVFGRATGSPSGSGSNYPSNF